MFKSETCIDGSPITDTNVEFELPMLLSINPKPSIISNKLFYFKEAPIKLCDALLPVVNNNREKEGRMSAREIEKMKKLTSFLSVSRADDYNQWWTVGITYLILEQEEIAKMKLLRLGKCFLLKVQSMMKVDVI